MAPKKGNIFFFTMLFSTTDYVSSLLNLSKGYFQVRKNTLLIVNYSETREKPILQGFYQIDDHQHFNIELLVGS